MANLLASIICVVLHLSCYNVFCSNNVGTEESLRENIAQLYQGKLKFSDENIPGYEGELRDMTPRNESDFDFIVIGAGSAGATVASRLSEVRGITVLLIEAGSKEYPIMDIPLMAAPLQLSNEINWGYETESSNKYCLGYKNNSCEWTRGKVMGGSSVLNFMVATRGNKRDYNEWANYTGDNSWSYNEMLKYLKKLEDFRVSNVEYDPKLHNKDGPVYITSPPFNTDYGETFMEAGKELGFPTVDYNGNEQVGFSYFQSTIIQGERWSTNRGYLYPAKYRENLFLTRNSHANKILINENKKIAYGVEFTKNGRTIVVKARKEIILSAGAINSPQILMLSGIGPAQHLRDLGINVIKDAPVGENLMDHVAYAGLVFVGNETLTPVERNILNPKNPSIKQYVDNRTGLLALGSGFDVLGYFNVDDPNPLNGNPDIELLFGRSGINDPIISEVFRVSDEYRDKMLARNTNNTTWSLWPMIMKPKSRGKLLLRSKHPNAKPKLYPNYLDHPDDIRVLIKGIRMGIKVSKTNAFQRHGTRLYNTPLPCDKHQFDSDDYWECALRTFSHTIYHQSGTCKMGRENDKTAVVDSNLQVINIKRLRVVDASVMPTIVSAHPNIPIIAIGEKIADVIKKDWGLI